MKAGVSVYDAAKCLADLLPQEMMAPSAPIGSPGDAPGVVCVGAADRDFGTLASFSSGGGTAPGISCFQPRC
jgi:hypothetical protein